MVNDPELPVGDRAPEVFRVVIEIPLDGTEKFEYDNNCTYSSWIENWDLPVHYPG